jgi:hypothetical protein
MKNKILILLFLFCNKCFAQFHDNTSIYGFEGSSFDFLLGLPDDSLDQITLTFSDGSANVKASKYKGIYNMWHTNSSFSNKKGEFVFLSNGKDVWNKNFDIIKQNGTLTKPNLDNQYHQFNLSLPMPNDDSTAILIYGDDLVYTPIIGVDSIVFMSNDLFYAKINMYDDKGVAQYEQKRIKIINDSLSIGKFTAVKHGNGRDWWIVIPRFDRSNEYYKLLLTDKGLFNIDRQTVGTKVIDGVGWAVFSPNGKKYVRYEVYDFEKPCSINIYDFDRCTGTLSNHKVINSFDPVFGGIAISPNSRFLYFNDYFKAYQFDLEAIDIVKSKTLISEYDGILDINGSYADFFNMQLMPDGKIYSTSFGASSEYFHIINKPNLKGKACSFVQRGFKLPARNNSSMPNFPNYRLGPIDGSPCDSLGINNAPQAWYRYEKDTLNKQKVFFTDLSFYEPQKWEWDFGDGSGFSNELYPTHSFSKYGTYKVCLKVSNQYGTHTHCKSINIGNTVSNNDNFADIALQVTPNPFKDRIVVALSELIAQPVFHLYDNMGRLIKSIRLDYGITEVATQNLGTGLYLWSVTSKGDQVKSGKIMKIE